MARSVRAIPTSLARYQVSIGLLRASAEALRQTGRGTKEAVILWQGSVLTDSLARITKLHIPEQATGPLHFNVPLSERLRLMNQVGKEGAFILAQLHTHPGEAFHSKADDTMAITKHTGAISIVVPHFGMKWSGDLFETSINIHLGASHWRQLVPAEVNSLFEVTE